MCGNKIYTAAGNDGRDNSHLCITIQMSSVEDRWHQNWAYASPTEYFTERSHLREPLWNSKSKMNFDQPDRYRDSHRNASIWKCQTPQSTHSGTLQCTEWRYQNFDRNRYRDFFYDTKFSETETETFFRDQIFPKPKPILFFRDQIFRNRNRDFFPRPNFSETETETFFPRPNFSKPKPKPSKIWQKSRDRDLNRDFSTSFEMKFRKFGTYKQNWNFWDQNLGL